MLEELFIFRYSHVVFRQFSFRRSRASLIFDLIVRWYRELSLEDGEANGEIENRILGKFEGWRDGLGGMRRLIKAGYSGFIILKI